jgi:hypothetical protein
MLTNNFLERGVRYDVAYASPSVDVLNYCFEGVICASYGDPNAPGKDLNQENEWDF